MSIIFNRLLLNILIYILKEGNIEKTREVASKLNGSTSYYNVFTTSPNLRPKGTVGALAITSDKFPDD